MSSRIQMLRPCVARIMSLSRGCNVISLIGTVGRFAFTRIHCAPLLTETNRPNSVPTYRTLGFFRSSVIVRTVCPAGMPVVMARHVVPKSVLMYTYGVKSFAL